MADAGDDRVYFKQLLSGRDFARGDMMARQMVNFAYLIGDRATGEAVVVDPAYAVQDLLDIVEADGMRLTGVLGTHFHPDHLGGSMGGWQLEGISALLDVVQVPVHVQSDELPWVERTTGVGAGRPGRPPQRRRGAGGGGGDRADPHSGPHARAASASWSTAGWWPATRSSSRAAGGPTSPARTRWPCTSPLHTRLARVPDDAILFPGHLYSADPSQSMGDTRRLNYVFRPRSAEEWMAMFGW